MRTISLLCWSTILSSSLAGTRVAQWVQINGPYGGEILSLAASGTSVSAAAVNGGVFRSLGGGASWVAVNGGIPSEKAPY